ncbi:MAG: glutamate 5-kinase [Parabacteroides sp.]|nr:glutamate 5-kinase [Parabacteroides sp.]
MKRRIVIKIGSNVLTRNDGKLDITRMSSLVDQVVNLHEEGNDIVLISSGAVASGKSEIKLSKNLDALSSRQLYSSIGQAKLINRYYELFKEQGVCCGQVLTTKESFSTRLQYLTQKHCMEVMLNHKVIPIVNENDTISVTELMFTDNDELSGLIASMINADMLIILSNVNGIYDGSPSDSYSKVIPFIYPGERNMEAFIQVGKSTFGRGGMLTKCRIATKVAEEGIEVVIANGKIDNILNKLIKNMKETVCTRFVPNEKKTSSIKKWIAHSEDFTKGEVIINRGAEDALYSAMASSILFVGVVGINGDFEKEDIVRIINEDGEQIGIGCVAYNSKEAFDNIGKKDMKPLIHYDCMYLYV